MLPPFDPGRSATLASLRTVVIDSETTLNRITTMELLG